MPIGSQLTRLQIAQMDCPTEEALIYRRLGSMVSRGSGVLTYPNFGILRRARVKGLATCIAKLHLVVVVLHS